MQNIKQRITPYVGIIPAMTLFTLFMIIPIFFNFYYAVTDYNGFPGAGLKFVGLDNFKKAFSMDRELVLGAIKNSFVYAFLITFIQNFTAVIVAIFLTLNIRFKNLYRSIYFFPNVLGAFIIASSWGLILDPVFGSVNKILSIFGLAVDFLGNPDLAIYTIIFVQIWASLGYAMIIYYTNIMSIPSTLYEAADIDGVSFWQKVRYIIIPLTTPAFTINILLSIIGSLKLFEMIFLMTGGGPGDSTQNLPVLIFKQAFSFAQHGYGSALNVIQFFLIFTISVIVMIIMKRQETEF